jgi:hemoglobin
MKKLIFSAALVSMSMTAVTFTSCSKADEETITTTPATTKASLYDRLGGIDAISAVTDEFLTNVVADNEINGRFSATVQNASSVRLLRLNLIDQICEAAGGPCVYKGKTMIEAHAGMNLTEAEFNFLVGDLVAALNTFEVPETEQNELLGALAALAPDIIGQ